MADSADNAIALVGAVCRLPGAADLAEFWANLVAGSEHISRFAPAQLVATGVDPALAARPDYVPARGMLAGAEQFDWTLFGYSPADAAGIAAPQRVLLECAAAALDDAAIDPSRFPGLIGVFAGSDYTAPPGPDGAYAGSIGVEKDFLATRIAYKLGLRGPALTVQTACSTSLVAVHQACQSLLGYECDLALAGGAAVHLPQIAGYLYQDGGILSRDGRCRPFDADAGGTVSSSGAGIVVLRRLGDALAEGHRILAVIRGSAVNNDGGEKIGFTAPSIPGQRDVIRMALARADVDPADLWYVEAHGTATPVGDPVEVAALTAAFRESTDAVGWCRLGAVKGSIGHTGAAAGVSGLIKTALQLHHRELVPTVHFRRPNPALELDASPFRIAQAHEPGPQTGPLLAGVSAFGVGGTNAHVVLESAPAESRPAARGSGPTIFCLSAATPERLERSRRELADHLDTAAPPAQDVAWTLAAGRRQRRFRAAWVTQDPHLPAAALRREAPPAKPADSATRVGFLFPGQGALRQSAQVAAAHALLPDFAESFDRALALLRDGGYPDLSPLLDPETDPSWFEQVEHQQTGLFVVGYALARQLGAWGVTPAAMLGNSIGEYVAATVAGLWDLPDALTVVAERARAVRATDPGLMLAIDTDLATRDAAADPVATVLADHADLGLAVAVDGPGRTVVSGPPEAIRTLRDRLDASATRLLGVDRAYHSPMMRPAARQLAEALTRAQARQPTLPYISNASGGWADPHRAADPGYWVDHLCGSVRLTPGLGTLLAAGCGLLIELGPGASMTGALRRHPDWTGTVETLTPLRDGGGAGGILAAVGQLWCAGVEVDLERLLRPSGGRRTVLPGHPFDSQPCRIGTPPGPSAEAARAEAAPTIAGRLAVVATGGSDGARIAEELAASGLAVGSVIEIGDPAVGSAPPEPHDPLAAAASALGTRDRALSLPGRPDLAEHLDRYSAGLIGRLLLERAKPVPGGRMSAAELSTLLSPAGRLPRLLAIMLDACAEHGFLNLDGDAVTVADDIEARVTAALEHGARLEPLRGVRRLVEHCVESYPAVLAGDREPISVLYPDGGDALLAECTRDNDVVLSDATACLDVVCAALAVLCSAPPDPRRPQRPWRVLEVGAGGGELTGRLLGALPADAHVVYHVTDISAAQLRRTASRLSAPERVDLRFTAFDMTADPVPHGLTPGTFDLVVAYNSVHVAADLPAALRNLGALLSPGGRLGLVETTRVALWSHLIWGLAPGWWDFDDGLRSRSAELDAGRWRSVLAGHGFTDVEVWTPGAAADHAAILAVVRTESAGRGGLGELVRSELSRQAPARPVRAADQRTAATATSAPAVPAAGPARQGSSTSALPEPAPDPFAAGVAAQWIRALGVPTARESDDFFELGGDSLAAVHLIARLREELHAAVPVGEFLREPTFARLRELAALHAPSPTGVVSRPADSALPRDLVAFRMEGSRTPLFLAAPATGTSLCYRELAALLDPEQPVFGLDSPGLDGRSRPLRTIEETADRHIAALRAVRPHGPYVLGGWSTGALVAHETARRLLGLGEEVELLLCLDGYVPDTGGRPLASMPGHLAAGLRYQGQSTLRVGPIGASRRAAPDSGRVFSANIQAMLRYRPGPVSCPVVVLKAGLTSRIGAQLRARTASLYPGGVRVLAAAGSHWTVLNRPHVVHLAETVTQELARVHGAPAAPEGAGRHR